MLQVPDTETLSILDTYFSMDISPGSYAREDINDTVYIDIEIESAAVRCTCICNKNERNFIYKCKVTHCVNES